MKRRFFGCTPWNVSEIGFGAWAIGGSWGEVSRIDACKALHAALDAGVTFIDTADVYGDGQSESIIRDVLKERKDSERPIIATKAGRRLSPHHADNYTKENLEAFIDRSLKNLGVDALDLLQLHCPPNEIYYKPEVFQALDSFVKKGKILYYGVSVEKVEEALKAINYPNVSSVQIIYNIFRQRPEELFFPEARKKNIAVIVRVPLASGLLSGKMTAETRFAPDDHRYFNRHGEAFDIGETFAGVPYKVALEAVDEIRSIMPDNTSMAQFALRWILMNDAVSVVIPGAKNESQAQDNAGASDLPLLTDEQMERLAMLYRDRIAPYVHHRW